MVLYAVGGCKRIFAHCEVKSEWYESKEGNDEGWPYRVDIVLDVNLAPSSGVDAGEIFPSPAELRSKVGRRSHVRLTQEQYDHAVTKLGDKHAASV